MNIEINSQIELKKNKYSLIIVTDWGNFPRIAEMDGQEYGLKILGKRLVP